MHCAAQRRQCLGAFALADIAQFGGDFIHRLLPANLFPLTLAALANALEDMVEPVGMLIEFDHGAALGAQLAAVDRIVGIAVKTNRVPIGHFDEHAAIGAAQPAKRALHVATE